jgi:L-cystine transport system permease protein
MRKVELEWVWYFFKESLPYLGVTFEYVLGSLIFGSILGAIVAKGRLSRNKIANAIAGFYITIVRCTPSVVLLFLIYFGFPSLAQGTAFGEWLYTLPVMTFVIVTFSVFIGASFSEIIRSAYLVVNAGQREAGLSVGMTELQTFVTIIFPQMIKAAIPNIGNTVIFLFKEGALAYTIGLKDVLGRATFLSGKTMNVHNLSMYVALTLIYWPLSLILEKLFGILQSKFKYEHQQQRALAVED